MYKLAKKKLSNKNENNFQKGKKVVCFFVFFRKILFYENYFIEIIRVFESFIFLFVEDGINYNILITHDGYCVKINRIRCEKRIEYNRKGLNLFEKTEAHVVIFLL